MAAVSLNQEQLNALIAAATAKTDGQNQLLDMVSKLAFEVEKLKKKDEEKTVVKPEEFVYSEFSLFNDKFTWSDVEQNEAYANGKYTLEACASDMCKCMRRLAGTTSFVLKIEDEDGNPKLSYQYGTSFEKLARMVKCYDEELCKDRRCKPNAFSAFEKYKTYFNVTAIKFYSLNPKHISIYHGLYYNCDIPIADIDMDLIQPFLDHVKNIICMGRDDLYNYVLDWVSFIVKNPNGKTGTTLCITGEQGSGKNTFTKVLQEMLHWYSRILEDIDHILGRWNALMENKKLIIGNEIAAFGEGQKFAWNKFKHLQTEDTVTFEEKNEPKRQSENYLNFILISNNDIIVPVEKTDRREVVLKVPSTYVIKEGEDTDEEKLAKLKYFEDLYANIETVDETGKSIPNRVFYENITSFFKNREYTKGFNLKKLPETAQKKIVQDQFKSYVEEFIEDNYEALTSENGMKKSTLVNNDELTKAYRKSGQSPIAFARQLNRYCLSYDDEGKRIDYYRVDGKTIYRYKLTPEYEKSFKHRLGIDAKADV